MTILFAPVTYGLFSAIANAPRPLETIGVLAAANLVDIANDLKLAIDLLNGKHVDEKKAWIAECIAENPFRALYPASLVDEFLLPATKMLAHNSVTSTQLLRSSEK
ncbi:hypothetical protein HZB78_01220 [Candidatus Collierbacteria bacterium]|nr:hypothetical protein [Candidatus Collierbacteria bacterium]